MSESVTVEHADETERPKASGECTRLLLVEDNPGDARLALEALKEEGHARFEVSPADTLERALKTLGEKQVDVVLLDLSLPDSHGIETFERVRNAAPDVAIIVLSGLDDEELATKTVEMGGQDYLVKGDIEGRLLVRAIRYALQRKKLENALRHSTDELKATQLQLMQAEKLESLGRLAAGVAHEVRNPLARILLGSEYLEGGIEPGDENIPRVIAEIKDSALRANEIVRGMVDFASARRPRLRAMDVNEIVERAARMVSHEVTRGKINLVCETGKKLPPVKIDPGKMEQVLVNVFMNAIHAMKNTPRGAVTVRTYASVLTEIERNEGVRSKNHLRKNDEVVIIDVEDEGCGISPESIDKLFDPFFTTKATGEGTGLGLTVVRKIVELHKGMITMENREEGGARAKIILKAANLALE